MYELIYRSVARPDISHTDILNILHTSRSFNSANDITGCLIFYNMEFIQLLEGDEPKIKGLYAKIERDKRHSPVILLMQAEKKEKAFRHWSMAYQQLNTLDLDRLSGQLMVKNFITLAQLSEKPTQAVHLFWNAAKQLLEEGAGEKQG